LPWQGSSTNRYQGGTAENIWRYDSGSEAVPLTSDYAGTSHNPMFWNGRVYFLTDRDGTMNVFSMDPQGRDVKQLTHHHGFDVQSSSLSDGKIVYQCGADLWLLDLNTNQNAIIPITLVSDFDQLRDHWVKKPLDYLTMAHIAPDGSAAVFTARDEGNLRYAEWEYSRRRKVEADSQNHIGYVHLRAMGSEDIAEWARDFYPVFDRQGLIIDVRHNHGGNIDSWILAKLLRRAWFYWQPRIGNPTWNMQYAFRGHIVVLCDQETASDGEAFSEGVRRLNLGKIIGVRTWGG
jgi:tricorn protease-like protein